MFILPLCAKCQLTCEFLLDVYTVFISLHSDIHIQYCLVISLYYNLNPWGQNFFFFTALILATGPSLYEAVKKYYMREEKRRKTRNRDCLLFTGNGGFSVIENQRNTLSDPLESVYVLSYSIKDILSSNGLPTLLKFKNRFRNYKINLSWYLLNMCWCYWKHF